MARSRPQVFTTRLNASERRLLDMAALEADMPVTTWARRVLTNVAAATLREAADAHAPEPSPDSAATERVPA